MNEVWQKVVELFRYWNAGRKAVNKAHEIINGGKTYREMYVEMKSLVEQYGMTPTEELKDKILTIHNKLKAIDRQLGRRCFPNNVIYQPPRNKKR